MEKLAIIGTGIAGMGCGHWLHKKYDITLFEQNDYIGGHTNTVAVNENGTDVFMDTGFMVFNFETYPHLCGLFKEIGAPIKKTDMSFSVQHLPSGLEYCGSGLNGLFAQRRNIFSPRYIKMLMQISRFNKKSVEIMDDPAYANHSLGQYIEEFGFGQDMLWKYLIPMSSAVWSTPMELMLDFPAVTLIRFFKNHGFLGLNTQHQWYTLEGGSDAYKKLLIAPFKDRILTNKGVKGVKQVGEKVQIICLDDSVHLFDKVIFASHGDQTLRMLEEPTSEHRRLLSPFKYQYNKATVHTDESIMPKTKLTWSSWNYRIQEINGQLVPSTIYWMNSLQGVSEKQNYFVSINAQEGSVDPKKIIQEINYEHPLFDLPAIQAQAELKTLNETGPIYFCGSYFKYGFHEDAYASAVILCKKILDA
ncbi:MAG: NADP transhydrogenase subunit alpha [Candidatus Fluviicola riflensis]|nr:MAG: NADP transhydrogenase subunit alpha [Candidatus Fluviicola riflensis]OGS79179.1 MAG: NADP transhydrogenase subunit alpha [Candidatus Fluviicola riflensis]OGS86611.1 MAG: NADP transhydrogenase subunit alpha [Fluviicola sp. RIFCSPHIGHO2_01_FULL_43_53]OGS88915.1 MAG: NADP transhydrogenase subunit alpha [Fluviicola sp. RIFCSPHIGHO2_12_FULL_43_24]